jgi:hypothetical protein
MQKVRNRLKIMIGTFFIAAMCAQFCYAASTETYPANTTPFSANTMPLPVIKDAQGSTNFGTSVGIPLLELVTGMYVFDVAHIALCNTTYCVNATSDGATAYQIFADPNADPRTIVHTFLAAHCGARCFLFCNRWVVKNVHNQKYVKEFIKNFGPRQGAVPDPIADAKAIALFGAFLNMRPWDTFKGREFLNLFLNNIKDIDTYCEGDSRCVAVMTGLKAYQIAFMNKQTTVKPIQLPADYGAPSTAQAAPTTAIPVAQ